MSVLESKEGGEEGGAVVEEVVPRGELSLTELIRSLGSDALAPFRQPWTASNQSKEQTDAEKARKLEVCDQMRQATMQTTC